MPDALHPKNYLGNNFYEFKKWVQAPLQNIFDDQNNWGTWYKSKDFIVNQTSQDNGDGIGEKKILQVPKKHTQIYDFSSITATPTSTMKYSTIFTTHTILKLLKEWIIFFTATLPKVGHIVQQRIWQLRYFLRLISMDVFMNMSSRNCTVDVAGRLANNYISR